jgi:hypothetical protein
MNKYKYIITTGWWCDNDNSDDRAVKFGTPELRNSTFFPIWYDSVKKHTSPERIYVIDSHSPVKPDISCYNDIDWLSLDKNAGHSTKHIGKYCGVSRSFMLSMMRVYCSDTDYWVYIEQDALLKGDGIVEYAISKMKKPMMFGCGWGTPQPIQQSMMIIKKEYIPTFLKRYSNIKATDSEISPEYKFAIATSAILRFIPEFFFKKLDKKTLISKCVAKFVFHITNGPLAEFQPLPFGFGRARPLDFNSEFMYFQHGEQLELEQYLQTR